MIKVHLDTDLGGDTDDLCALAYLLKKPDVQITGITTNTELDGKRAAYTKYALNLANREEIQVKSGADIKEGYFRGNPDLPTESDFWPEPIVATPNPTDQAIDLLKSSIDQGSIVIGIGSYTNLYLLDQKYPGTLNKAKIYLMGGHIFPIRDGYPQWGNEMDWNVQVDIKSAKYVLENSSPTLVPLTVTVETAIQSSHIDSLNNSDELGKLMAKQAIAFNDKYKHIEPIGKRYKNLPDDLLNFQHDALTCAIALGYNQGIKIQTVPLKFEIKDDHLYEIQDQNGKSTNVVTQIDGPSFNQHWLDVVSK